MPNYSLEINSQFQPMSFERMLYPLQEYTKAYKEQQEALADLDAKASIFDGMLTEADGEYYNSYNNYMDSLQAQRDAINNNGLDINSRNALYQLKSRFAKDIKPLEDAYADKKEYAKARRNAYINSNGKLRFGKNAEALPISQFLNGNSPDIAQVNLDDVYKDSATIAAAESSRHFSKPEIQKLNDLYNNIRQTQGIDTDEVLAQLEKADSRFGQMAQSIRESIRYDEFDSQTQKEIDANIRRGMFSGTVYKVSDNPVQNPDHMTPLQKAQLALQQKADARAERQLQLTAQGNGYTWDRSSQSWVRQDGLGNGDIKISNPNAKTADGTKIDHIRRAGKGTTTFNAYDDKGNLVATIGQKTATEWTIGTSPSNSSSKANKGVTLSFPVIINRKGEAKTYPLGKNRMTLGVPVSATEYVNPDGTLAQDTETARSVQRQLEGKDPSMHIIYKKGNDVVIVPNKVTSLPSNSSQNPSNSISDQQDIDDLLSGGVPIADE